MAWLDGLGIYQYIWSILLEQILTKKILHNTWYKNNYWTHYLTFVYINVCCKQCPVTPFESSFPSLTNNALPTHQPTVLNNVKTNSKCMLQAHLAVICQGKLRWKYGTSINAGQTRRWITATNWIFHLLRGRMHVFINL
jgi:hypothetical protein